ncbi:MAG: 50S ribosomal protein L21 [Nitrospinaceae bacterium]
MYAVLKTGGKQYKVTAGDEIRVEKLSAEVGDTVTIGQVLMIEDGGEVKVGAPFLDETAVTATVTGQMKAPKIIVFKKRRRKKYRRKNGHRQPLTCLKITGISEK